MSMTELKIPFSSERLDALRFFMEKKELSIEQELKNYLDKTYERMVPSHVREYVESRLEPETVDEQTVQAGQNPAVKERQPRASRRQREQAITETVTTQPIQSETNAPEEDENQGMTLGM